MATERSLVVGLQQRDASATVVACPYGPDGLGRTPLATSGDCQLLASAGPDLKPFDLGDLSATVGNTDIAFTPGAGCYVSDFVGNTLFTAGEPVSLTATGGADLPAFELMTTAPSGPSDVTFSPSFTQGQDYQVTWTPSGTQRTGVLIASRDTSELLQCKGPDDGSLTVPAALTSQYPSSNVLVGFQSQVEDHAVLAGPSLVMLVVYHGYSP